MDGMMGMHGWGMLWIVLVTVLLVLGIVLLVLVLMRMGKRS